VLGLWIEQTEGTGPAPAKAGVLAQGHERTEDPRRRDILIAVVDGLKGFPEAIATVFPLTMTVCSRIGQAA
jgi:putative transposase